MPTPIVLVGEDNPYGADPAFALYPAPDGCSGHRLCCNIFGMRRQHYLDTFERMNLCSDCWDTRTAKQAAGKLWLGKPPPAGKRWVLLGSKVSRAFLGQFKPFTFDLFGAVLILPHPSGRCRIWRESWAVVEARKCLLTLAPELAEVVGKA